jgi:hypothetical protein
MPVGELQFNDLRDAAKEELSTFIAKVGAGGDKTKAVLVEPRLHKTLIATGLASEVFTEANGVKLSADLDVRTNPIDAVRSVVMLVRPSLPFMREVATVINIWNAFKTTLNFHVVFVPKAAFICCHMLQNEYRLASKFDKRLEVSELELDFFVTEDDALSMEQPTLFRDLFMEGDTTSLQYIAKALVRLQTAKVGLIPRIISKGNVATRTLEFMKRMFADVGAEYLQEQASQIDRLFILDRGVDLATPLVTQLTYHGMIDEAFGIVCGTAKAPFEIKELKPQNKGLVPLTSAQDEVYDSVRDLNFVQVGTTLHKRSLAVKAAYDRRKELQIREVGDFLRRVPEQSRLLAIHTAICSYLSKASQVPGFRRRVKMEQSMIQSSDDKEVIEYVEELLNKGEPMVSVLRFLCLMSVTNGGLKTKLYETIRESFMLSYGIPQTLAGWYNLERTGLLTKNTTSLLDRASVIASLGGLAPASSQGSKETRVVFSNLRKACRLWVDGLNEAQPNDVAYAYSGYAPLLLRTVEALDQYVTKMSRAQQPRSASASTVGGSTTTGRDFMSAKPQNTGFPALDQTPGEMDYVSTGAEVAGTTKTVLVFVIGGVTASEVSAIRTVLGTEAENADGSSQRTQFVVATTAITTGASMIESVLPFDP